MKTPFEDIVELYKTGNYSVTRLGKIFKVDRHRISHHLIKIGISVINKQNETKFNQHVFDSIDTEEKAYWLGFLFADGYINSNNNAIELSLALKDKDHLEKFKLFLQWSGNVKVDHFRCRLSITNKHLKQILVSYGCTPRKSLTLQFPEIFIFKTNDLVRHFIRGYFDGDGCIYVHHRREWSSIELLGTNHFLNAVIKNLKWNNNKLSQDKRHSCYTFRLRYAGKTALNITASLYNSSTIYLDRKYKKYKDFAVLYGNI